MGKNVTKYLIVRASGDTRVVTRYPWKLRNDEVAYHLRIKIPDGWGNFGTPIEIQLPEPILSIETGLL